MANPQRMYKVIVASASTAGGNLELADQSSGGTLESRLAGCEILAVLPAFNNSQDVRFVVRDK